MAVSKEDVKYVAELARIRLNDIEIEAFQRDLNSILEYFDKLNELDTGGVIPTANALDIKNRFRDDTVKPSLDREKALENARHVRENSFLVPKIIE